MKSFARPSFWRAYNDLDSVVRKAAKQAYKLFESSPDHPSLRFKKLAGTKDIWSARTFSKISRRWSKEWRRDSLVLSWVAQ